MPIVLPIVGVVTGAQDANPSRIF